MALRDLLLFAILMASIPVVLYRPWIGILLWYWIGLMNPHRLTWGFMYDFPVAMLAAAVTLAGLIIARDREPPPPTKEIFLLCAFGAWVTVTSYFAWVPNAAWDYWEQFMKVLLFTVLASVLIHGRQRVEWLVIVVTGSIAFYGFKGGYFSLISGFQDHVLGPERSFISGNTTLGLALVMVLPLILVLSRQLVEGKLRCLPDRSSTRFAGWMAYLTFWLTGCAVLGTFSRGAMLALATVAPFMFVMMRYKIALVALGLAAVLAVGVTFPDKVVERMQTLQNIEEDGSAMSRIEAWGTNWNIASANPLTGAGFDLIVAGNERWLRYSPMKGEGRRTGLAAHSIYFQVLGHHGFVGLGLYLGILISVMLCLFRLARRARRRPDTVWIAEYSGAILIGTIGYAIAGAFLSMAYFTLFYAFVALTVILRREYEWALGERGETEEKRTIQRESGESASLLDQTAQASKSHGHNRYRVT